MNNEVDYYRACEEAELGKAMLANLWAILNAWGVDKDDPHPLARLNRNVYKYTNCGAWVGVKIYVPPEPESFEGGPGYSERPEINAWIYDEDQLAQLDPGIVIGLQVGWIIEGVDQTTETHEVDFINEDVTEADAVNEFNIAIATVEEEAEAIWNDTHGCKSCGPENESGYRTINPKCKHCKGYGMII